MSFEQDLMKFFESRKDTISPEFYIWDFKKTFDASFPKATFNYGASKWVFTTEEIDYVIKIPRFDNNKINYCEREAQYSQKAKEYRVEKIILPVEFIGETSQGIKFYKQKKISYTSHNLPKIQRTKIIKKMACVASKKENRPITYLQDKELVFRAFTHTKGWNSISRDWYTRAYQIYGKKFMKSFDEWLRDCDINDLHSENTGYYKNQPILLDFSGYE